MRSVRLLIQNSLVEKPVPFEMSRLLTVVLLFLTVSSPACGQDVMPFTRTWTVLGTKLSVTAWESDATRAERGSAQARAAVLRLDSTSFLNQGEGSAGRALLQALAIDVAVDALRAEGVRQGSAELAGNARYFGKPPQGDVWGVAIRSPADEDQVLALVTLEAGAVAGYSELPKAQPEQGTVYAMAIGATALEAAGRAATLWALGQEHGCALAGQLGWSALWLRAAPHGNDGAPVIVVTRALRGTIQLQSTEGAPRPTLEPCRVAS